MKHLDMQLHAESCEVFAFICRDVLQMHADKRDIIDTCFMSIKL